MSRPIPITRADDRPITGKITILAIGPKHLKAQLALIGRWVGGKR